MTTYPREAGWKEEIVSRGNARYGKVRFARMQAMVLELYRSGFTGTADEAASALGISPFSARPRCSELVALGKLEKIARDDSHPGRSAWILGLAK